jgi:hypothetical protein
MNGKNSKDSVYYDIRSEFWEKCFNMAQDYESYLEIYNEENSEYVERWLDSEERTPDPTDKQSQRLKGYNRELKVLMYCGVWCGDCSRQGPILKKIAEVCGDKVQLRLIEREVSKKLQDELRMVGALRVPVMVFLSEDFWEVSRFGDRTHSVYRSKLSRETGIGVDKGILSPSARMRELEEWVEKFERALIMLRLSPPLRRRYGD